MTIRHSGSGRSWNHHRSSPRRARITKKASINCQIARLHGRCKKSMISQPVARRRGEQMLRRPCVDSFTVGSRATARPKAGKVTCVAGGHRGIKTGRGASQNRTSEKPRKVGFACSHSQTGERGVVARNSGCDNDQANVGPWKANHVSGRRPARRTLSLLSLPPQTGIGRPD